MPCILQVLWNTFTYFYIILLVNYSGGYDKAIDKLISRSMNAYIGLEYYIVLLLLICWI